MYVECMGLLWFRLSLNDFERGSLACVCFQANNYAEYSYAYFSLISSSNLITEMKERQTYPVHQNENPLYESTAEETLANPLYDRCGQFFCLFI